MIRNKMDDTKFADIKFYDFTSLIFKVSHSFIEEEDKLWQRVCYS